MGAVNDPDAVEAAGEIFVYWLVWTLPPDRTSIPIGWSPETAAEDENEFGKVSYGGPVVASVLARAQVTSTRRLNYRSTGSEPSMCSRDSWT